MIEKKRLDMCAPGDAVLRVSVALVCLDSQAHKAEYFNDSYSAVLDLRERLCLSMPDCATALQLGSIALLMAAGHSAASAYKFLSGEIRPRAPR